MGEQCVRAEILVPTDNSNLQLWYPNGYGKPHLYPFEATINIYKVSLSLSLCFLITALPQNNASSSLVTIKKTIGLRHLELVQVNINK